MILQYLRSIRKARQLLAMEDLPSWQRSILEKVRPFTMAGDLRTVATIAAVEYVVRHEIAGDIVECGVWRGGQMMAAALTLIHIGAERDIYLFDTFEGMTKPQERDLDFAGTSATPAYEASLKRPIGARWCEASYEDVSRNLTSTGYPDDRMHLVRGTVETTIPSEAPKTIAYLRLDTDWYASTAHELEHLYPRVSQRGVVTIDDYGHWRGAREATDEYLQKHGVVAMMHRIDYSARQFVKV